MPRPRTVIVAGGGIAGIAAAVRLAEHGVAVTLLETRRRLGGRATSFVDPRTGETLDNCQHVALGCCTNYLDLLDRLGAASMIRWTRSQHWIEPGGRVSVIRPGPLPAPLHFTRSLLAVHFLSLREVAAIGRAALAILRTDRRDHAGETFDRFLDRLRQPPRAVRRFWAPVVVSACNLPVERVSAEAAIHVFQEGFLASARAADIGLAAVPLVHLYDRAHHVLAAAPAPSADRAPGRIVLGAGVERLDATSVLTTDGRRFDADRVICALPVERVTRVLPPECLAADPRFAPLDRFTHSPILGVHLAFDRPVLDLPHAVLVDRPTHWLFRKDESGRAVHAVISAADDWMDLPEDRIAERVLADVHDCLPASRRATLLRARSVKERRATFALTPEVAARRPGPTGPSGVILAGDYTATGWPATMEGAARSGYAAAAAALELDPGELLIPSLAPAAIPRALARA
jgi:zeta-carotene desaturase